MNTPGEVKKLVDSIAQDPSLRDRDGGTTSERDGALLLGGAAINLAVIAEAITKLVANNPDPKAPLSLRDLTDDERETVEALRDGRLVVMPVAASEAILNTSQGHD